MKDGEIPGADNAPRVTRASFPRPQRRYSTEQLFGSDTDIEINHNGVNYVLRQTRSGGLILHK